MQALSCALTRNDAKADIDASLDHIAGCAGAQHAHHLARNPRTIDIDRGDRRPHIACQPQVAEAGDGELIGYADARRLRLDDQALRDPVRSAHYDIGLLGQVAKPAIGEAALAEMAGDSDFEPRSQLVSFCQGF
mgnify:CR=1 FL=1